MAEQAEYALRKALLLVEADVADGHAYVWEHDRWLDLVVALILEVTSTDVQVVRLAVDELDALDLLGVRTLAKAAPLTVERFRALLSEAGIPADEARMAQTVVGEAARSLHQHWDGRVERYLRNYGERMLDELAETFTFSALDGDAIRRAFTLWLQNALNMPVSLHDESLVRFAETNGVTVDDLVQAADRLDLNLAVLDDLAAVWLIKETEPSRTADGTEDRSSGR